MNAKVKRHPAKQESGTAEKRRKAKKVSNIL